MAGRKGMSPIIATILLIAFAVALGAMIMNWSSSLVAGEQREEACKDAGVRLRQPLCFQDNSIKVDLVNNGESTIATLILRIESPELTNDIKIKESFVRPGNVLVAEVPSVKPKDFVISLIPVVQVEEEQRGCTFPVHTTQELPPC